MKGDMRFKMPLWQMGFIFLLIVLTFSLGMSTTYSNVTNGGFQFEVSFNSIVSLVMLVTVLILMISLVIFSIRIRRHNKQFPNKKINAFSFKPQEYIDDDEFFEEMTKRATKKVYSYYTWTLPLLVGLSLGGFWGRTAILIGILVVALGQYWIYYSTMKKMFKDAGDEE